MTSAIDRRDWWMPAALMLLSALLLMMALPLAAQDSASPAAAAFDRAEAFAYRQDHRAARIALMNAIKQDPSWSPAHVALAITNLRLFDAVGAEMELRKAARLGVAPSQLRHLLGEAYWLQGRYPAALEQLQAGDMAPEHRAYAARIMGRVFMDQGDLDAARAAFDLALEAGGNDAPLWTDIGRFRLVAGDMAGAVQAADRALRIDGRDVRALEFRGRLVRAQFGLAAALPWFEQALGESPDDVPVLVEYGATLGDLGRHRAMLKVARTIAALQPDNPRSYFMQAVIAARAHDFALAQRLIGLTEGRMDDVPAMMLLNGAVAFGLGNDLVAAGHWSRLADAQPLNATARLLAARALYKAGNAGSAADRLTAQRAEATTSYGDLLSARALEALGQRDQAMVLLNRAQTPGAADQSAILPVDDGPAGQVRALMAQGEGQAALSLAAALQSENPGSADAAMLLGDVRADLGDSAGARAAYAQAETLEFSPGLMLRLVALARRSGDIPAARDVLVRFLRFNPADVTARRLLAETYLAAGRNDAAAALYADVLAVIGPNDAALQADYARALLGAGRADDALKHARIGYRVQPGNPEVVHIYGFIALEAGKLDEAVEILAKAVTLLPGNGLARARLNQAIAQRKVAR